MIFIFTNKGDAHPTNVIKYLASWGVPVFRLNTECLLSDYKFSWWCNDQDCDFYIKNNITGLSLYGHEISAIWDRRPASPQKIPIRYKDRKINKFLREEALGFLQFLRFYLKNVYSIGNIVEDRPASSKMLQLSIARKLGMLIPDTIFSNTKDAFVPLLFKHKFISLKPINAQGFFTNEGNEYVFYSRKANNQDILSQPEEAFNQTTSFLQNYVDKKYELRITACNSDVIACKIDSQSLEDDKGKIDWRQGYDYGLKQEIVEVPEKIKEFCALFLKEMQINFGCFDFIVTPDNEYVFLECNPNGQWLWIELQTGCDISKMIATNLAKFENKKDKL